MPPQNTPGRADDEQSKLEVGKQVLSAYTPGRRTVLAGISSAIAAVLATNPDTVGDLSDALRSLNRPDDVGPLDLVPTDEATHRAVRSGQWSDADVWAGNQIPGDDARVLIEPETTVTLASETAALKAVRVDGTLAFDTTAESHLRVDTMVTTPGSRLRIGTPEDPMQGDAEARITFLDFGPIDETVDPDRVGRGLIVMGDFTAHGAEKTSWTTLDRAAAAGDDVLSLTEAPTNWRVGDTVVIPDTTPPLGNQDEERTIAGVNGKEVRLEETLEYDHVPPKADLDSYVLNLTRNVRFESENDAVPRRGHIIIHSQATDTRYAGCYDLGRTDKSYSFTNPQHGKPPKNVPPNPRARYAFHFHRTGIGTAPHYVEGLVVDGSPGWGVVNHHSHADVTESVTYDVFGSGFVAEAGNERGSFERNFALRSEGSGEFLDARQASGPIRRGGVDDFGHGGHGFWLQGPLVEVEDNVAAGHRHFAYVFWNRSLVDRPLREGEEIGERIGNNPNVPIEYVEGQKPLKESERVENGKVPASFVRIKSFANNEAFASGGGIDISRHQFHYAHTRYDEYGVIDAFTAYNIGPLKAPNGGTIPTSRQNKQGGNIGVNIRFARNIMIRDARLIGVAPSPHGESPGRGKSVGVHRNTPYGRTVYVEDSTIEDWEIGIKATVEGFSVVRGNVLDNHINVDVPMNKRATLIEDNEFRSGDTAHVSIDWNLEGTRPQWLFGDDWRHGVEVDGRTAYYRAQAPDFVPIPSTEALERLTSERKNGKRRKNLSDMIDDEAEAIIGKTNRELSAEFDIAVRGAILPDAAERDRRLSSGGLLQPPTGEGPDNEVWLEAQNGSVGDAFSIMSDPNASLGKYIVATGVATAREPPTNDGIATYEFEVESGTYNVYARTHAPRGTDGAKDSLWVRLDKEEWIAWENSQIDGFTSVKIHRGFIWAAVESSDGSSLREFELDAGKHVLEIGYRGPGLKIDKLLVAADETTPIERGHPADNA